MHATTAEADDKSRFERKRERVIDAAATLINRRGVKGLTFVDVAQAVGLNTASVTYYFKRKELLAAAALGEALDRLDLLVLQAAAKPGAQERVAEYLRLWFDLQRDIRLGRARPIAILADIRAMDEPLRSDLMGRYQELFRHVRGFFGRIDDEADKARATARAHVLNEVLFWLPLWLPRYALDDYDRVRDRLMDLLVNGIAPAGAAWAPQPLDLAEEADADGKAAFLRAATRLLNERGYRGTSVKAISAALNVTKGSFYHHLDAKDDLVMACLEHSHERASIIQVAARDMKGTQWQRLCSAIAGLLRQQLLDEGTLLRTTAMQALPSDVRDQAMERTERVALRFAGMLSDGAAEGSTRPVDALIVSEALIAMVDSAYEMRKWASRMDQDRAIAVYASTLAFGMLDD